MPDHAASHQRWSICGLLFFAATINYMDRQVIALLKPVLQGQLGWTEIGYSNIVFAFHVAYAAGLLVMGRVVDRLGTRKGFSLSVLIWSAAAMAHALARSVLQFAMARFALGLGESGNFPASIKTIAEWFPKKERALATGIFNSGTNIGAMISALFVPWCLSYFGLGLGWKMAFILTGGIGFIWLIFWGLLYSSPQKHKRLSTEEYRYIHQDDQVIPAGSAIEPGIPWITLFGYRQTWSFFWGKFLTDGVWWFYLFWLPDYLIKQFGMTPTQVTWPVFIVYGVSILGNIFGGGIPLILINKG